MKKEDQDAFFENLKRVTEEKLRVSFETIMERFKNEDHRVTEKSSRDLMYCDFYDPKNAEYTEVLEVDLLKDVLEDRLEDYNRIKKTPLNIVIFRFCDFAFIYCF